MRILFLSPDHYRPEMPARPAVMEVWGRQLPAMGHDIVITAPVAEGPDGVRYFEGVPIHTVVWPLSEKVGSKAKGIYNYYTRLSKLVGDLFSRERFDLVQVRDDVFAAVVGRYHARKNDVKFSFQYSIPQEIYLKMKMRTFFYSSALNRLEASMVPRIMNSSDLALPITATMRDRLEEQGVDPEKMMPFPMGINPDLFRFDIGARMAARREIGLDGQKCVMYLGTQDKVRQVRMMVRAFARVRKERDDVRFLFVGEGSGRQEIIDEAGGLGISDDIIMIDQVPYERVPFYISACDVGISPFPPIPELLSASPTKMLEYMAVERPVVGNREIAFMERAIVESGGGVVVDFEPGSFAGGILEVLSDDKRAEEMGRKGREWAIRERSYVKLARQIEEAYQRLLE